MVCLLEILYVTEPQISIPFVYFIFSQVTFFFADKMNLSAAERILKPEVRQLLDEVLKVSVYKIEYNQSCHCF
jgi:hypothetical protein